MLEIIEVSPEEEVSVMLEAFIKNDQAAISTFNEKHGTHMRESEFINLSSFMIEDQVETLVHLAVDIREEEDVNYFIVAEYSKDEMAEYTFYDTFSEAYDFYNKHKETILQQRK